MCPVTDGDFEDLVKLIKRGEDAHLEVKATVQDPRSVARHVAALANSGGGKLVVGWDERSGALTPVDTAGVRRTLDGAVALVSPALETRTEVANGSEGALVVLHVGSAPTGRPALSPDGAVARRDDAGRTVPLPVSEALAALSPATGTRAPTSPTTQRDQAIEELQRRLVSLQQSLDDGFNAAALDRRWHRRAIEWGLAGVVGAVIAELLHRMLS